MEAWRTERNGGEELKTKDKPIDPVMELLSWCDIKVRIIDPSLKDLGISDECKRHIAGQVLGMLTRHNLKLSREHPSIFLVVESHTLVKDLQKPHFKFQCKIMIFTDQGPKNFAYTLFIPVQNAGSIGKPTGVN